MSDIDWDKIVWREVTQDEYWNEHNFTIPHRESYVSGNNNKYELGTIPPELPTKVGAIVAPPQNAFEWKGLNSYVLSKDGKWYELQESYGPYAEAARVVQGYLENGWIVAFEGIED